jgi:AcrR family transcriptional regulator
MIRSAAGDAPSTARKRRRNRRGEGARLRVELIEAGARLLESTGDAHALTLAAVAREAGIAAPSIYRHFSDRAQLVEAVVADRFQRLDEALLDAMTSTPGPAEALRACCDAYCRFGLEHPGHYQVLFSANLALDPTWAGERPGERVFGRLVTAVQACIDAHAVRPGDASVMAVNIWVALHGIVSLRTSRPNHMWPPVDTLVNAALSGQVGLADNPLTARKKPQVASARRSPDQAPDTRRSASWPAC